MACGCAITATHNDCLMTGPTLSLNCKFSTASLNCEFTLSLNCEFTLSLNCEFSVEFSVSSEVASA